MSHFAEGPMHNIHRLRQLQQVPSAFGMLVASVAAGICMRKPARNAVCGNAVCDSMYTVMPFTQQRRTTVVEQRITRRLKQKQNLAIKVWTFFLNNYTAYSWLRTEKKYCDLLHGNDQSICFEEETKATKFCQSNMSPKRKGCRVHRIILDMKASLIFVARAGFMKRAIIQFPPVSRHFLS